MSELRDLYQQVILDHGKNPRHQGPIEQANCADGHNPMCGDRLRVFVKSDGTTIQDVSFEGNGCAISVASASMMSEALRGRSVEECKRLFAIFHEVVTGKRVAGDAEDELGKLVVFGGVQEYPMRVKCATLAWHTLQAALDQDGAEESGAKVSTE